jgi:hypothetical protein
MFASRKSAGCPKTRPFSLKTMLFAIFEGFWPFWAILLVGGSVSLADNIALPVGKTLSSVGKGLSLADRDRLSADRRISTGGKAAGAAEDLDAWSVLPASLKFEV